MNKTTKTILQALIDGKTIQLHRNYSSTLVDLSLEEALNLLSTGQEYRLRVKPKTIRIGDFDVPVPMSRPPKYDEDLWVPNLIQGAAEKDVWCNTSEDLQKLANGLCHSTKEAAQIHTEALLSFTKEPK